jgi:NPCBM/NEW2 domain
MPRTSPHSNCRLLNRGARLWLGLLICLHASRLLAQEPPIPLVDLWTTAGEHLSGSLAAIDEQQLRLRIGDQDRTVPPSTAWQIALSPGSSRPPRPRFWLHLTNGDRLGVSSVRLTGEALEFRLPFDESSPQLGVEFITGIQPLKAGTSWRTDESEWLSVVRQREKSDLVVLRNGDRQLGEFTQIGTSSLELSGSLGKQVWEWPGVAGLLMNPDLAEVLTTPKEGWLVLLADDSWLTATAIETTSEGRLVLTAVEGVELSIALANIRGLTHWGPEAVPLSRLPITEQQHVPLLGETLKVALDRNVRGLPLRHAAAATPASQNAEVSPQSCLHPHGLGLSSGMTVRWNLDAKYRRFQSGFGLDATSGQEGHATVTLTVDDRPPQTITLRAGEPMLLETMLDLTDARVLTIETGYGKNADASDWINLYAPVLVP